MPDAEPRFALVRTAGPEYPPTRLAANDGGSEIGGSFDDERGDKEENQGPSKEGG